MITVYVPPGVNLNCFEDNKIINGRGVTKNYFARTHNGHIVIPLTPAAFREMISGPQGILWERENGAAIEWLHQNKLNLDADVFPGEGRAPLEVKPAADAAPVMVKLIAPAGTSSFSHNGTERTVSKDRTVTVENHVADVLRTFGFSDAA